MNASSVRYSVTDWDGNVHSFTAKNLYKHIMQESKNDFNWIATASSLVEVCQDPSFPAEYALGIKVAILNCFANIEHRANKGGDNYCKREEDLDAIEYCFNSLYNEESDEAVTARTSFLTEFVASVCRPSFLNFCYHPGLIYKILVSTFIKSNVERYISKSDIDLKQLKSELRVEFNDLVEAEEKKGSFDEDERKHQEEIKKIFSEILL